MEKGKNERLVIIGGVAAGMSAASQAKRLRPELEVIALEKGPFVSYGACGMPYNIMDPKRDMEDLIVVSAREFREERRIDVRTGHEVVGLEPSNKTVHVHNYEDGSRYDLSYDSLVIATGARAVRLPIPGADLDGVFVLRDLGDGMQLKKFLAEKNPKRVAIIGAGYIGMEMAEAFRARGNEVFMLEKLSRILPGYEEEITGRVEEELERNRVKLHIGAGVTAFQAGNGIVKGVETDRGSFRVDSALMAAGIKPNVELARESGAVIGDTGAIYVNEYMETSIKGIWAAGDCAEAFHRVTGMNAYIPLGTTANKQGRVAGANASGGLEVFRGIVGTAAFKVFDLEVARTGLSVEEAKQYGLSVVKETITASSRAESYQGGKPITVVLTAEEMTGRLLGAQMVGAEGVAKRIDTYAAALYNKMTLEDISNLDLSYAPPFSPVWDPVLVAANVAKKRVASRRS